MEVIFHFSTNVQGIEKNMKISSKSKVLQGFYIFLSIPCIYVKKKIKKNDNSGPRDFKLQI